MEDLIARGIAAGKADLNDLDKVPAEQLPSYVDSIVEVENKAALPTTGQTGKIYAIKTGTDVFGDKKGDCYRWSGSQYILIGDPEFYNELNKKQDKLTAGKGISIIKSGSVTTIKINFTTFDIKGQVQYYAELPTSGMEEGDTYYVKNDDPDLTHTKGFYMWVEETPSLTYWLKIDVDTQWGKIFGDITLQTDLMDEFAKYVKSSGGQLTGSLDANNQFIINIPTPVNDGDAVNKKYADDNFVAKQTTTDDNEYLYAYNKSGDTRERVTTAASATTVVKRGTGGVVAVGDATADSHAVNLKTANANYVAKSTSTTVEEAYGRKNGTETTYAISDGIDASTIALRDANGILRTGYAQALNDAINKQYFEDHYKYIGYAYGTLQGTWNYSNTTTKNSAGFDFGSNGPSIVTATDANLLARTGIWNLGYSAVTTGNYDSAVKHALSDADSVSGVQTYTDSEKDVATNRLGAVRHKVTSDDKTYLYALDKNGDKLIDGTEIGKVQDVKVNGTSVVTDLIANLTVDDTLSATSENPLTNKVVNEELNKKVKKLATTDDKTYLYAYDKNGDKSVDSNELGKVQDVIVNGASVVTDKKANLTVDDALSATSEHPLMNRVVNKELAKSLVQNGTNLELKSADGTILSTITDAQICDIIKETNIEFKNKTLDSDLNTIKNLIVANFKAGIVDTSDLYTTDDTHIASSKLIAKAIEDAMRGFKFTGYVTPSAPTGTTIKDDEFWYESSATEMPTTFPIQVHRYAGGSWSSGTEDYTPENLHLWANKNNNHGYYWFGNAWNLLDFNTGVDNTTIDYNTANLLEVKDRGITLAKLALQSSADAGKSYVIANDGSTVLNNINQYTEVSTFVGVTGNTYTEYYLNTPCVIGTKSYEIGVYIWNSTDGFKLIANTGDSSTTPIIVGVVSPGSVFPTTRPDGAALVIGDYVKPYSGATFPFTISGITFTNSKDIAVYMSPGNWLLNATSYQTTGETPIVNKAEESYKGSLSTAVYQKAINVENAAKIIDLNENKVDKLSTTDDKTYLYAYDNGGQKSIDSAELGKVQDVKVNGTTVVTDKVANLTVDTIVDATSENPLTNKAIYGELEKKLDKNNGTGTGTHTFENVTFSGDLSGATDSDVSFANSKSVDLGANATCDMPATVNDDTVINKKYAFDNLVTLNTYQVITNKIIDLNNNTLNNIQTGNFSSDAISTAIPESGAVDTKLTTEKAVKDYSDNKTGSSLNVNGTNIELKTKAGDVLSTLTDSQVAGVIADTTATFKNKTIDVDNNTVSNIETDNLKADVLELEIDKDSTDTQIPSAKATWTGLETRLRQYSTMPAPTEVTAGTIVQYIGSDETQFATGNIYKSSGSNPCYKVTINDGISSMDKYSNDLPTATKIVRLYNNQSCTEVSMYYANATKVYIDEAGTLEMGTVENITTISSGWAKILFDSGMSGDDYVNRVTTTPGTSLREKTVMYDGADSGIWKKGHFYQCQIGSYWQHTCSMLEETATYYTRTALDATEKKTLYTDSNCSIDSGYLADATTVYMPGTFPLAVGTVDASTEITGTDTWVDITVSGDNYLALTGGTLTGALAGTTASFSGQVTSNGRNVLDTNNIVNNLTSSSTTDALSAAQGKTLNEKFSNYLALAGGYMNGGITVRDTLYPTSFISNGSNNGAILIRGGSDSGAQLHLSGTEASDGGNFYLIAQGSSSEMVLKGEPNGNLTWNDDIVLTYTSASSYFLPLIGGTMTGALDFSGTGNIKMSTDTGSIRVYGGSTQDTGACVILHGGSYSSSSWAGTFSIETASGPKLVGKPDGTLTWNDTALLNTTTGDSRYLQLSGGTMTGTIYSNANVYLRGPTTDKGTTKYILGGKDATDGASLQLADGTKNGYFFLKACNTGAANSCYMEGRPDGTLNWGSNPICVQKTATMTKTYSSGFSDNTTTSAGINRAVKISDNLYFVQLSVVSANALSTGTSYEIMASGKFLIDGLIPKYTAGIWTVNSNLSLHTCWMNYQGKVYVRPQSAISASSVLDFSGFVYCS